LFRIVGSFLTFIFHKVA